MKFIKSTFILFLVTTASCFAQQKTDDQKAITNIINQYSQYVITKDSVAFYALFIDGPVTWSASLKGRSYAKEVELKGIQKAGRNYFSGSYKGFMRGLSRYETTEDKFDNIRIIEDGTVAAITMDYSFWANGKMTNWGGKYLTLIKQDGNWKIACVVYSLELTPYFKQPLLKERQKQNERIF